MAYKLIKVAKELNVGLSTVVETLHAKGFSEVESKPMFDITEDMYGVLMREFSKEQSLKKEADALARPPMRNQPEPPKPAPVRVMPPPPPAPAPPPPAPVVVESAPPAPAPAPVQTPTPTPAVAEVTPPQPVAPPVEVKAEPISSERVKHEAPGLKVLGKIDLNPPRPAQNTNRPSPTRPAHEYKKPEQQRPRPTTPAPPPPPRELPKREPIIDYRNLPPTQPTLIADNELTKVNTEQLRGLKILGKVDTSKFGNQGGGDPRRRTQGGPNQGPNRGGPNQGGGRPGQPGQPQGNRPPGAPGQAQGGGSASDRERRKRKVVQQPITAASLQASMSGGGGPARPGGNPTGPRKPDANRVITQKEIEDQIKATKARLDHGSKGKRGKFKRDKRSIMREKAEQAELEAGENEKILHVAEFVSVSDLASVMDVSASQIIAACMSLGIFVGINQRLDAEVIEVITGEFGFEVKFVSAEEQVEVVEEEAEDPADIISRPAIVTVMGHVDHGKTSLLDFIRSANVTAGEAGGITQHIGAYEVMIHNDPTKKITFLDTPGHEAFTAMRARGAKVTDIAVIIVASDDSIMPQTKEAISHAQAAGVPIVFAINKIDKAGADPERIKAELAQLNFLVEEWGGKYQSQDISAKSGLNVDKLLEKILFESEILDLKANPKRRAIGTVIEASLEKGRGYVSKLLIENGTLREGDPILSGEFAGKVKAMFNERNQRVKSAGPAAPVLVLGLPGAPQAGEKVRVTATEGEAREIATKRAQILREQSARSTKRISLEEIGRRLALGNFKELNIIVKGDVDGSIEALSDSLMKLSIEKVQLNVIHKAVGQIVDSDIMLASASDAIVVGFQVRPSVSARKLAEQEGVEIKMYSIIYEAIEEIKAAIEGMLEPTKEEEFMGYTEIREVYKINKLGSVAGCYVQEGRISRNHHIRIIRDGIVVYPMAEGAHGELGSLKRYKDDMKEIKSHMECGLTIKNYNNIEVGDVIESYIIKEVKAKLS
jgi:translation initiation factor IF-2